MLEKYIKKIPASVIVIISIIVVVSTITAILQYVSILELYKKYTAEELSFALTVEGTIDPSYVVGMRRYTDLDFGFSFTYPEYWKLAKDGDKVLLNIARPNNNEIYGNIIITKVIGNSVTISSEKYGSVTYTYENGLIMTNGLSPQLYGIGHPPGIANPVFYTNYDWPVFRGTASRGNYIVYKYGKGFLIFSTDSIYGQEEVSYIARGVIFASKQDNPNFESTKLNGQIPNIEKIRDSNIVIGKSDSKKKITFGPIKFVNGIYSFKFYNGDRADGEPNTDGSLIIDKLIGGNIINNGLSPVGSNTIGATIFKEQLTGVGTFYKLGVIAVDSDSNYNLVDWVDLGINTNIKDLSINNGNIIINRSDENSCSGICFDGQYKNVVYTLANYRLQKIDDSSVNINDWQTYKDEKYGFEFKYPQNFSIVSSHISTLIAPPKIMPVEATIIRSVFNNKDSLSADDMIAKHLVVAGNEFDAYKIDIDGADGAVENMRTHTLFVLKDNKVFSIALSYPSENSEKGELTLNQIIPTFKLSKESSTTINNNQELNQSENNNQTANWKTYKSADYGFEFKYPNGWSLEQSDLFTTIKSPDFKSSYYDNGAEFLTSGSKIRFLNGNKLNYHSIKEYLDSSIESGFNFSQKKEIKIGNIDGIEYYHGYEGPVELFVNFVDNNNLRQITFMSAGEERKDKDYTVFNQILSTFKFITPVDQTVCPMYCLQNMLCGSDGKDYCNECLAKAAGATVAYEGRCGTLIKEIEILAPISVSEFDFKNNSFNAKDSADRKNIKIKTSNFTKYSSTCQPEFTDFTSFYNLNKNWEGYAWLFGLKGTWQDDITFLAQEINCTAQ